MGNGNQAEDHPGSPEDESMIIISNTEDSNLII